MPKLKIAIVDDESLARNTLRSMIGSLFPQHEIVAECADIPEAVVAINNLKPDLVFLDVEMPRYSGLDIVKFYPDGIIPSKIVFVTGYNQYALQAFDLAAIDYLLKPLSPSGLQRAIERAEKATFNLNEQREQVLALTSNLDNSNRLTPRMLLKTNDGYKVVQFNDIVMLEADGSYTNVHINNQPSILISKRLGEFDHIAEMPNFFRTHRSFIVNLKFAISLNTKGGLFLEMANGLQAQVTQENKDAVIGALTA